MRVMLKVVCITEGDFAADVKVSKAGKGDWALTTMYAGSVGVLVKHKVPGKVSGRTTTNTGA